MLFHLSISAKNPKKVTDCLAEIIGGEACDFPGVEGAGIAFSNDGSGTAVEVYPIDTVLGPGEKEQDPVEFQKTNSYEARTPVHFALISKLSPSEVVQLGKRENWRVIPCRRGNLFNVIELWLENRQLIEVITPEAVDEAISIHNAKRWNEVIRAC